MSKSTETKELIPLMAQSEPLQTFLKKFWSFDGLQLKHGSQFSDPVEAIVVTTLKAGEKDATYWLDAYSLSVDEKLDARKEFLSKDYSDFIYYDDNYHFLDRLASNAFTHGRNTVDIEGNDWLFDQRAKKVLNEVQQLFEGDEFQYVAPMDYQQRREDCKWSKDYPLVKDAYTGFGVKDPINDGLQINAVLYDDVEQGRSPPETLVSIIFGYALYIRQHNNTVIFQSEVDAIDTQQKFTSGGEWKAPTTYWISTLDQYNEGKEAWPKLTQEIVDAFHDAKEKQEKLSPEDMETEQKALADEILSEIMADEAKGLPKKYKFKVK